MKKIFPIILAAVVFIVALVLLRPAPSRMVVVAATDFRAGHVLANSDLTTMSVPDSALATDVITDKSVLIGQPLRIDRGQGDVIRASQVGNLIQVQPNERAVAVKITDSPAWQACLCRVRKWASLHLFRKPTPATPACSRKPPSKACAFCTLTRPLPPTWMPTPCLNRRRRPTRSPV